MTHANHAAFRLAVNQAKAVGGVEVAPADAVADLERAARVLVADVENGDDETIRSRSAMALANVHAALSRIRQEAEKRPDEAPVDDEQLDERALAWLRKRGKL
jgi:hypothetical protein